MVLWGKNALEESFKSGTRIEKVYLQYGKYFPPEFLEELKKRKVKVQWAKKRELTKRAKTEKHQGIVFIISPVKIKPVKELIEKTIEKNSFFVVLDRITEPQNLGAIGRSVEFFGGIGILLPEKESAPLNETAVKASSGALMHLIVSREENLEVPLKKFKSLGGNVVALETGGKDLREVELKKPLAIIVGSEGKGISKELLKLSSDIATIKGRGKTPSLNASVATGIILWEALRKVSL